MKIGFIGLGNVGGKLAGSLQRNGFDLTVLDLDRAAAEPFLDAGAVWAKSPREVAEVSKRSGVDPREVSYIEADGTGTPPAGDHAEATALGPSKGVVKGTDAFQRPSGRRSVLGSYRSC